MTYVGCLEASSKSWNVLSKLLQNQLQAKRTPRAWGGDKGGFSLADIPIGTHLYRYFSLDLPRPDLPNVERPYRRLLSRPAHRAQSAYLWTSKGGLISDTDR